MRYLILAMFLAVLSVAPASADIQPNPYVINTMTRCSGTITSGGTSQTAITASSNAGSKFWFIENPTTASEALQVDFGEAASASSVTLNAGQSISMGGQAIWQGSVTVNATTTSHAFTCFYGQ